jgi:hypothetical protein
LCESVLTSNLGVQYWKKPQQLNSVTTKVKSHGLYELKSGMFAKSTQVTWTPLLGQSDFTHLSEKLLTCTSKTGVRRALNMLRAALRVFADFSAISIKCRLMRQFFQLLHERTPNLF